ncbi:universal stress protein UspA [Photobacterium proteolyticum]|uniref:Universal stress protein UspA n=1 Tax=Photobacterium proteolyticum TaxID=1903952 RepID=A0A1Q9GFD6_9GAMM|nr:universal stress protein [Photobacterium proteolyticum]OLQ73134.1 universal stress protein UspA [Photobacterium proteolyticum]
MFSKIMVPVDLRHEEQLTKSLDVVAKLAKVYGSKVVFVGVSLAAPTEISRNPEEYKAKLALFTQEQSDLHNIDAESHPIFSVDPTADLNKKLLDAIDEIGADLILMATHIPNVSDYIFANHGNYISDHADISVFLVRG